MLKIFFNYLSAKRFLHYSIIGGTAFMLDYGSLFLLKEVFGLSPVVSVILNQPPTILYVFLLNKFWSFKAQGDTLKQAVKFSILMAANYLFAVIWMWFWIQVIDFSFYLSAGGVGKDIGYMVVRLANIILAVSWNFLLYKHWVYRAMNQNK